MKNLFSRLALAAALGSLAHSIQPVLAQGTAFTYQGQLSAGGSPANGNYDLTFSLFTAGSGGTQVGDTLTNLDVGVTNGLFIVTEDFGAVYDGTACWLQIGVRTNDGGAFISLSPLQELTPAPYAVTAENVTGTIPLAQLPGTIALLSDPGSPGSDNFFAGQAAGNASISGVGNTGTGGEVLVKNGNGSYNTANGRLALYDNLAGSYNTADGAEALEWNSSGSNNTATGFQAMANVPDYVTGSYNTADGVSALTDDDSGSNNTAIGVQALAQNTTGNNNTAVGYFAGYDITGSSNIDIGNAGLSSDNEVIRIGDIQTQTYLAGIYGASASGGVPVLVNPSGKLGSTGTIANNLLANNSITVTAGTGLSGGGTVALGGTATLNNTGVLSVAGGADIFASTVGGAVTLSSDATTADTANTIVERDPSGYINVSGAVLTGPLFLPELDIPASIYAGNTLIFVADDAGEFFAGPGAGNYYSSYGTDNTGVGSAALANDAGGSFNTAVGCFALYANTNGSHNTAFGYNSLGSFSGSYNIALGDSAGESLYAGNNNIEIGNVGTVSDNNVIRIGTPGTQTQTFLTGNVGIGVSSTAFPLEVQASQAVARFVSTSATFGSTILLRNTTASPTLLGAINFENGAGADVGQIAYTGNNAITFNTASSLRLTITNGGLLVVGTVTTTSDRNAKEHFQPVDALQALEKVAALPITRWNFKQDAASEHIGPMAQDFYAAFNVGPDDKHITTTDEEGVALAAIQGLNQKVDDRNQSLENELKQKDSEIEKLKAKADKVDSLEKQNDSLAARLNELEAAVKLLAEKK